MASSCGSCLQPGREGGQSHMPSSTPLTQRLATRSPTAVSHRPGLCSPRTPFDPPGNGHLLQPSSLEHRLCVGAGVRTSPACSRVPARSPPCQRPVTPHPEERGNPPCLSQLPVFASQQRSGEEGHGNVQGQASALATLPGLLTSTAGEKRGCPQPQSGLWAREGQGLQLTACNGHSLSVATSSCGTHPEQGTLRSLLWSPEGTTEAPEGRW